MLLAVDIKESDFEWQEPAPEVVLHTVQETPAPAETTKPEFFCRDEHGNLVEAGEFFRKKYDALLATPGWLENLQREQAEAKATKQRAREERIEARRQKRKAA